jgi:hypothetical protein
MSSADTKLHCLKTMFFTQRIVSGILSWSLLALLHFQVYSAKIPGLFGILKRAEWSVVRTHIFEAIAYLAAGVLCLTNWCSPQIPGGYSVWLVISIAMLLYFLGKIFVSCTEIVLQEKLIIFLAGLFFVITYFSLEIGMMCLQWITSCVTNYQNRKIFRGILGVELSLIWHGRYWWNTTHHSSVRNVSQEEKQFRNLWCLP